MKFKFERGLQIVNDLILYCHRIGATDYQVDFNPGHEKIHLCVRAHVENLSQEVLEEFTHAMIQHRQQEMEDTYWTISYDLDSPCEPTFIGMMLDNVKIDYDGKTLTICGSR